MGNWRFRKNVANYDSWPGDRGGQLSSFHCTMIGRPVAAELERIFPNASEANTNLSRTSTNIPEYTANEARPSTFDFFRTGDFESDGY
jgi:hypothetical protein